MGEGTKLQDMLEKKEVLKLGGGPARIENQHAAGKLTVRERLELLFDPGSFQEYNIFMKHRCHDFGMEKISTPAEGVVTGYGLVKRAWRVCFRTRLYRVRRSHGGNAGYESKKNAGAGPGRRPAFCRIK